MDVKFLGRYAVKEVTDPDEKRAFSRSILEELKAWFEVDKNREKFIAESAEQIFIAGFKGDEAVGFLTLKETGKATVELAVMGVKPEYHRSGIGRELVLKAKEIAKDMGYKFMQVKTVAMGMYEDYDRTNRFYQGVGFEEFEVLPELWDEANPCQIYVMYLG